jgi:hypothetical protein
MCHDPHPLSTDQHEGLHVANAILGNNDDADDTDNTHQPLSIDFGHLVRHNHLWSLEVFLFFRQLVVHIVQGPA